MEDILKSLVTLGGFGFFNYKVLFSITDFDSGSSADKHYFIAFMSSFNYFIYLIINNFCSNIILSIMITILISFVITLILPFIFKVYYWFVNFMREKNNLPKLRNEKISDMVFNEDNTSCFIFNFEGHLISKGVFGGMSGENEEFSYIIYPFIKGNNENTIKTEAELFKYLNDKKIQTKIYLNFEKQIKVIFYQLS
ncbi:hypothetical protein D3854_05910 [Streptococcus mutans]|jgi:hypothetical protein|uniref:hypothetical protein n=2 Tax=Streptococcus mutans TaxID=1309 RepID=UPI0002B59230|nr:hypothetical protein [Streptococcus mutans]AMF84993.1 hypothetical protein APQ13_00705 [Streptococcus mutans]EMC13272.1 hypothetical protein SMU75_01216 [Streptococcus mutans N3209]MCY7119742.1 hypothetical protein [Streptococcus mutans]MDP5875272.1 hypothetical protein [Streptococcus mutans]MDW5557275.1 hypothetical protein [Streptococcus mutans]